LKNRDLGKKLVSVNRIGATGSSWGVSEFKSSQSRISRMNEWHESYPDYSCHSSICVMRTPSRALAPLWRRVYNSGATHAAIPELSKRGAPPPLHNPITTATLPQPCTPAPHSRGGEATAAGHDPAGAEASVAVVWRGRMAIDEPPRHSSLVLRLLNPRGSAQHEIGGLSCRREFDGVES
jgi:hypothetical protein